MRLCVLIPSEAYRKQAGTRIRYRRIETELQRLGHSLRILNISDLDSDQPNDDVYLISKCYDIRSHVAVDRLKQAGCKVGIDLFDDYFSQTVDSRFVHLRAWLRQMLDQIDFVLCSTPAIGAFVGRVAASIPVHIMNDPMDLKDQNSIGAALERKGGMPREQLPVAWFGIGDNPYFPVGLDDLAAFGDALASLRTKDTQSHLKILTNTKALLPKRLQSLSRLPLPYSIEEWSEASEKELLESSDLVFLPVNCQNFSVAKSLNRAVTALTSGCQVLSVGYPLYELLADFIYRDPAEFMADWKRGRLRLRLDTVPDLVERLATYADAKVEAAGLIGFLEGIESTSPLAHAYPLSRKQANLAVVFGLENQKEAFDYMERVNGVTVASPFTQGRNAADIHFSWRAGSIGLEVSASKAALEKMNEKSRQSFEAAKKYPIGARAGMSLNWYEFSLKDDAFPELDWRSLPEVNPQDVLEFVASYDEVMQLVGSLVQRLFPQTRVLYSEAARLPLAVQPSEVKTSAH